MLKEFKLGWLIFIVFGFVIFFLVAGQVLAAHTVLTSNSVLNYSFDEDDLNLFNISIQNVDAGQNANITEVNISLQSGLVFAVNTNGTNIGGQYIFSNTSTKLTWKNLTYYIINGSETKYFWFNAIAIEPGDYNLTVTTRNSTSILSSNITVEINDTLPRLTVSYPSALNYSQSWMDFNLTASENLQYCTVSVNGGANNNTLTLNSSGTGGNYTNSSIADGNYVATFWCNDSVNNINKTVTKSFGIDTTAPTATIDLPASQTYSVNPVLFQITVNEKSTCTYSVDAGIINTTMSTSDNRVFTHSNSGLSDGNKIARFYCNDSANNWVASVPSISFTVAIFVGEGSTTGTGGTTTNFWSNTFGYSSDELSSLEPYTKELKKQERIGVKIEGVTHYIGVVSNTATSATINVTSTPQQSVFNIGDEKKFEITEDRYYDLLVKLNNITNNYSNVTLSYIHEQMPIAENDDGGAIVDNSGNESGAINDKGKEDDGNGFGFWIIAIVILVVIGAGVVAYFFVIKKKRL